MNTEELELSLKTEFESHLKTIADDMRREVAELQGKFDAEFAKHRTQLDQMVQEFSSRIGADRPLDSSFKDAVTEHLRLARDEGARITATAIAEAEQLSKETAAAAGVSAVHEIRKSIFDISTKNTQSAILKSLVQHASAFTPRGVFFIVKNDRLVGWKCFGSEAVLSEDVVREVSFPINQKTMPGTAVNLLSSVDSNFDAGEGDSVYLDPLGFGRPEKMYAVPLLVRGRAVAVVYADHGTMGGSVDVDALETIVRVAGLTVEILAAGRMEKAQAEAQGDISAEEERALEAPVQAVPAATAFPAEAQYFEPAEPSTPVSADFTIEPVPGVNTISNPAAGSFGVTYNEPEPFSPTAQWGQSSAVPQNTYVPDAPPAPPASAPIYEFEPSELGAGLGSSFGSPSFEPPVMVEPPAPPAPPAPVQVQTPPPVKSRFTDRNIDLPIDVSEDERRMHNDARRFARLLVSEIKLYNEQKVREGREAQDLYERLRDAIDRSREMYDKRVQTTVANKFDYFHYELVNTLAEGDSSKLGSAYRH